MIDSITSYEYNNSFPAQMELSFIELNIGFGGLFQWNPKKRKPPDPPGGIPARDTWTTMRLRMWDLSSVYVI
ncbi:MAG: hypothetical protein ABIK28_01595 [Planctomycetota bacterium]